MSRASQAFSQSDWHIQQFFAWQASRRFVFEGHEPRAKPTRAGQYEGLSIRGMLDKLRQAGFGLRDVDVDSFRTQGLAGLTKLVNLARGIRAA